MPHSPCLQSQVHVLEAQVADLHSQLEREEARRWGGLCGVREERKVCMRCSVREEARRWEML
eukprot:465102-Pelagomonas_calceolata.AAC.8